MSSSSESNQIKKPSFGLAIAVILTLVTILFLSVVVLKISIQAGLCVAFVFIALYSKTLGYKFDQLIEFSTQSLSKATYALWIFIVIGGIIGTWMLAGTVPAVIYYGLGFISPSIFLPAGLILCSLTALCTGTSWGTIGTMGIALMGIGQGLGIPVELTAGMIVSGAAFGDKMSPISDTTNLSAVSAGSNLYDSIRAMIMTMTPAYIISLILFTVLGLQYGSGSANLAVIEETRSVLAANFNLNPMVLLPIVILLVLNLKKFPALPAMAIGVGTGILVAVIFQGASIGTAIEAINSGFSINTGSEFVDPILNRGGIQSMMWTFSLAFIAISIGGILDGAGYVSAVVEKFIDKAQTVGTFNFTVMLSSLVTVALLGEAYLSFILNGNMYKHEFDKRGLDRSMLARVISEGGLMMTPLMPWTTFGAFTISTLGLEGVNFAPYAFLCLLSPLVSVICAFLGIFVIWKDPKNKGKRNFEGVESVVIDEV